VKLQPLTGADSVKLVTSLLKVVGVPGNLHETILQRTEGNPFFVEEVVRTLIDDGAIVLDGDEVHWNASATTHTSIPNNVQALLTARIDRLDKEARRTLEFAAVIGRTFQHRVLVALSGDAVVALDKQLDTLQRTGLIIEATRDPELTYAFRHGLTRDAAYASILHRRRREIHRRVGEAIETVFANRLEDEAHRLAYHFDRGRDFQRALKYYAIAGDRAAFVNAHAEAVEAYKRAVEIARAPLVGTPRRNIEIDHERLVHLYTRYGRSLEICGEYDAALENYRELGKWGRETGQAALELAALIPQATLHSTFTAKFDPQRGRQLSERALNLARELNDVRAEAKALWNLMLVALYAEDDREQALAYGEESLMLARKHDLREELAYTLHDLANAYAVAGRNQEAQAAAEEAGELWRQMGNLPMLVDNLANSAWARYQAGQVDEAIGLANEAQRVSRSIDSLWGQAYSLFTLAPFYLEQRNYGQAIKAIEDGIPLTRRANFDIGQELAAALGGVFGFLGDLEHSVERLHDVVSTSHRPEDRLLALTLLAQVSIHHRRPALAEAALKAARGQFPEDASNPFLSIYRAIAPVIVAEVAFLNRDYDRALAVCEEAIRNALQPGAPTWNRHTILADLLRIKGQALLEQDLVDNAVEALRQALDESSTRDSDRMSWMYLYILWQRRTRWKVLWTLGTVAAQQGQQSAADALQAEARAIVQRIGDGIKDEALRAAFVALPDVRALLDGTKNGSPANSAEKAAS
jgi:tetratricopeptide (TPR) repeat protein